MRTALSGLAAHPAPHRLSQGWQTITLALTLALSRRASAPRGCTSSSSAKVAISGCSICCTRTSRSSSGSWKAVGPCAEKQEVARFLEELPERFPVYQAIAEEFSVVDDDRVVVEGRMRWMDDDRVLRDDSMIWALEFRDELLYRSSPARSLSEAHAILAAGGRPAEEEAKDGGR